MTDAMWNYCGVRFGYSRFSTFLWHPKGYCPNVRYSNGGAVDLFHRVRLVHFTALRFPA